MEEEEEQEVIEVEEEQVRAGNKMRLQWANT